MKAVLALGSNMGGRLENLHTALEGIASFADIIQSSAVYETPPEGFAGQDNFLNAAVLVETECAPLELLDKCRCLEDAAGRVRSVPNGPRPLDVDIIFYGSKSFTMEGLEIPHPRWAARDFVITPLLDLNDKGAFEGPENEMLRLFLSTKKRAFEPVAEL